MTDSKPGLIQPVARRHGLEFDATWSIGDTMRISPVVAGLFSGLLARERSPWLVVVVRFEDDPVVVPPGPGTDVLELHRRLFTSAGTGTMNMVDYFHDCSHGKIDVGDSEVVGVYTIPWQRGDYIGNAPSQDGKLNRGGVLDAGRAVATAHQIDLSRYSGIVVCGFSELDLCGWVGGMAALCSASSLSPDLLGQEMGHGYGLNHSGLDGSTAEYGDPWDTMSTWSPYSAWNADYGRIGPGLNAVNMRLRGWLNEERVIVIRNDVSVVRDVELGPLHDEGLQPAALDIAGLLVEFRLSDRWDAGIPRACVLIHRTEGDRSALMTAKGGENDLVVGSVFETHSVVGPRITLTVTSIDADTRRATVHVEQTVVPFKVPDLVMPDWSRIPHPGPVEVAVDPRVARLHALVDRYATTLEIAGRYGTPQLPMRSLQELAEELGRQAASTEVTTFHEGYSFLHGFAPRTAPMQEPHRRSE